jgi:hypothetical protein
VLLSELSGYPLADLQLEAAHFRRRAVGRAPEEGGEGPDVTDIVVARLLDEVAHRHVFDQAPAQRADGRLAHRGLPFEVRL